MTSFEWDEAKNRENQRKHGVSFEAAEGVFFDPYLIVREDATHSVDEPRFFAFGKVAARVMTVRFTLRANVIRIFGGGVLAERSKDL